MPPDPTTLLCTQKQFYPSNCGLIAKYSWNLNLQEGGKAGPIFIKVVGQKTLTLLSKTNRQ